MPQPVDTAAKIPTTKPCSLILKSPSQRHYAQGWADENSWIGGAEATWQNVSGMIQGLHVEVQSALARRISRFGESESAFDVAVAAQSHAVHPIIWARV